MSIDLRRKLVSQEDASIVESARIPRSTFINRWTIKDTFDQGFLVPVEVQEVFPGDNWKLDVASLIRMSTPLVPNMDRLRLDIDVWYCPIRLVWPNFEKMMGEQNNPGDSTAFTIPVVTSPAGGFAAHSIYDHFGIPVVGQITAGQTIDVNALPLRMYNLIWNENYRDQNLQNSVTVRTTDTGDVVGDFALLRRNKMHDYFTTLLPTPQKFTAPSVPLLGTAPVVGIGFDTAVAGASGSLAVRETGNPVIQNFANWRLASAAGAVAIEATSGAASAQPLVFADLSAASGVSINALREAFLIQEMYERDARGGTRYTEHLLAQWGVKSDDSRLQRPEYCGGGTIELTFNPIAQTATGGSGLGSIGAAATGFGEVRASYASTEHGYIIILASIRSELSYQQGLHRLWSRRNRLDIPIPILAELGEQAVLRQEIYCTGVDTDDNTIVGYQERYHEVRTEVSKVKGAFRSTTASPIDQWHLAQRFTSAPVLGDAFIRDEAPMSRVLTLGAAAANQQFLATFVIDREVTRAFPRYGTPASLTRF